MFYALRPDPVNVDVAQVERRPFAETVEEQGRTRGRNPFTVTAPIAGRLLRTELDEGDIVVQGQIVARIAPSPQDQRTQAYAEATFARKATSIFGRSPEDAPRHPKASQGATKVTQGHPKGSQVDPEGSHMNPKVVPKGTKGKPKPPQ